MYLEWVDKDDSLPVLSSFEELMEEVLYAYEFQYPIRKLKDGRYIIHKLTVGENFTEYKGNWYKLIPGVYYEFEKFLSIKHEE